MPSEKWADFAAIEATKSPAYNKFYNAKRANRKTMATYAFCFNQFMKHLKAQRKNLDYESLVQLEEKTITEIVQQYIYEINEKMRGNSVQSYLNPVKLFFGMNDKNPNPYIMRNAVKKEDAIPGGGTAATTDDVFSILQITTRPLERALIHFLASTGMRPGALADPILRLSHLTEMPDGCKAVRVYDQSKEGYWAFLTPEATESLERYLLFRKNSGEKIDDDSPLFKPTFNTKHNYLTASTARDILIKLIKRASIQRVKNGNRFDKATMYMFRKRFNTILKINNHVNSNIAEKLMAHKRGLDGTYLQPTKEECFVEFRKAIAELTVDPTSRQKELLKIKQTQIDELEQKTKKIDDLEEMVTELRSKRSVNPDKATQEMVMQILRDKKII